MGSNIEVLKLIWFAAACIGAIASLVAGWESFVDLRFILDRRILPDWPLRRMVAKQAFRDELAIAAMQLGIFGIRLGALYGPSPTSDAFRNFWATDGTLVMLVGLAMTWRTVMVLIDRHRMSS